jgi:hypothetical protein
MADQIDFTPDAPVTPPPTAAVPAAAPPTINFTPDPPVNPNAGKTFAQADPNAAEQAPELADTTPTPDVGTHMSGKQVAMALGGLAALPLVVPAAAAMGAEGAGAAGEDAAEQLGPKAAQALKAQLEKNGFSNVVPKPSAFVSPEASRATAQAAAEDAEGQLGPNFLKGYKAATQATVEAAKDTSGSAAANALNAAGSNAGKIAAGGGAIAAASALAEHYYFLEHIAQEGWDKAKSGYNWLMNQ